MWFHAKQLRLPTPEEALPGRTEPVAVPGTHFVNGAPMAGQMENTEEVLFGMGCFWGAERFFWETKGVVRTAVGYAGGYTPNPTYEEVCAGMTGHVEVVRVTFDPRRVDFEQLLAVFWEGHDPTQAMRQGADVGTQYRSAIFAQTNEQLQTARASLREYQHELSKAGHGAVTTQVEKVTTFYFAEAYHQQYLAKNPDGYCGHGGTGVACPVSALRNHTA